ncbi:MAG TPA: hypothetical protein VGJ26_19355 [Pirellulales bacterium]|jgi:hypothetical protein
MVNIQLQDEVAAALTARARAEGMSLEAYLEQLAATVPPAFATRLTGDELMRLLDEASVAGPSSNGAYSRADIYLDHD